MCTDLTRIRTNTSRGLLLSW